MKNYVITGGAGFIGAALAQRLLEDKHGVLILDDLSTGHKANIPQGAEFHAISVADPEALSRLELKSKIDAVFHFAAQSSGEISFADPALDIDTNYKATYAMLEWSRRHNVPRFIYASSMSVYGEKPLGSEFVKEEDPCEPVSYYGCNKLASEKLIEVFTRRCAMYSTSLRFFNVYGPGQNMNNLQQGMVSIYMAYLMKDQPVQVKGSLDRFRDFIFIDDLVDVILKVENAPDTYYQAFNVGTGVKTTVRTLLETLLQAYGKKDFQSWVRQSQNTPGDIMGIIAKTAKLKTAVQWDPRHNLADGIRKMKIWVDETKERWN